MIRNFINKKGSIALTLVLVTSSMLLVSGVTVLLLSIDLTLSSKNINNRLLAEIRATTCFEESMFKLKLNTSFTGNVDYSYADGSCSGTIAQDAGNPNHKIIDVSGTIDEYTHNAEYVVDVSTSPISVL